MKLRIFVVFAIFSPLSCVPKLSPQLDQRPNFLVILADDMGYSDLGVLGSEISTPNLDSLASDGVLLTNFHVAPTCSPTRAMLLSGTDTHIAGLGTMSGAKDANQQGQEGYEGYMTDRVVTIASLLNDAGYFTSMAGKWHLGETREQSPEARGFEKAFVLLQGGASHFGDSAPLLESIQASYREGGVDVSIPDNFFSSDFYTDKLIEYLQSTSRANRPFFAYAAYTAPHWPLQAPDDYLERYRGVYDAGYDSLYKRRVENLIERGVVRGSFLTSGNDWVEPWDELNEEQKSINSRRMEIYAAMVENMDHNIGRLINFLKKSGQYENTVIVFFSDNGAEGNSIGNMANNKEWIPKRFDNSYENMGRIDSYVWPGAGWAQAQTAPFRLFKAFPTEGGVRTPAIVTFKQGVHKGAQLDLFASVKDVAPTLLEFAGVAHPKKYHGREVASIQGASMVPLLLGDSQTIHANDTVMGWELFGRRGLLKGNWKLVWVWEPYGTERWELFDLANDPGETNDLAEERPKKKRELIRDWESYVRIHKVVLPARDAGYGLLERGH